MHRDTVNHSPDSPALQRGIFIPQTGRNAGRAFWSRLGAVLATPPAGTDLAPTDRRYPAGVLLGESVTECICFGDVCQ
jgi:hypothetical protein